LLADAQDGANASDVSTYLSAPPAALEAALALQLVEDRLPVAAVLPQAEQQLEKPAICEIVELQKKQAALTETSDAGSSPGDSELKKQLQLLTKQVQLLTQQVAKQGKQDEQMVKQAEKLEDLHERAVLSTTAGGADKTLAAPRTSWRRHWRATSPTRRLGSTRSWSSDSSARSILSPSLICSPSRCSNQIKC